MSKILYTDLYEYSTDQLAQDAWVTDASGLELDYFEYASDGAAQTAYVSSDADGGDPPSWDLLDEDCSNISDWVDNDEADGVSSVDPAGQFKFDSGSVASVANRSRDIGSIPNTFTIEIKLYMDAVGVRAAGDYSSMLFKQIDEALFVSFASNGLFVYDDDDGWVEIGTDLVKTSGSAEWQTWRFLVTFTGTTGDGTCDIYLNDSTHTWEKVATNKSCSYEGTFTDGEVVYEQRGGTTANRISHMDYIKIYDGLKSPVDNLQSYSESTIKNQGSYSLKGVALITDSLNDTLTKSGLSIDLSGKAELKIDFYASRTGTNLQIQLIHSEYVTQSQLTENGQDGQNNAESQFGQGFKVSTTDTITKFMFKLSQHTDPAPDAGTLTGYIYSDDGSGKPNAVLATFSNMDITTLSSVPTYTEYEFTGTFVPTANTQYHIVIRWTGGSTGVYYIRKNTAGGYADGTPSRSNDGSDWWTTTGDYYFKIYQLPIHTKNIVISSATTWETTTWDISGISNANKDDIDSIIIKIINADADNTFYVDNFRAPESLQCYSEDTIKVQGDYSLKVLTTQTASLNKTLTKTLTDYLDYSIQDVIKFDVRGSRTGSNIKLKIHDIGGDTQEHTINIVSANTWQTETWDITGISGTKRDQIDKIIIEIINADSANTIYIDNLYSKVTIETAYTWIGG